MILYYLSLMLIRVTEEAGPVTLKETVHAPDASRAHYTALFQEVQSKQANEAFTTLLNLTGKADTIVKDTVVLSSKYRNTTHDTATKF